MSRIGQKNQTLCITHLPQIASFGDTHFFIAKSSDASSTISSVYKLKGNNIVQEIARMMGGDIHTKTAIQHAEEMIHHAKITNRKVYTAILVGVRDSTSTIKELESLLKHLELEQNLFF